MDAIYNKIGHGYDATRRADPQILKTLATLLRVQANGNYLDVACGTGNYTVELAKLGGNWKAFDQSLQMLAEAKRKSHAVEWSQQDVAHTNYPSAFFNAALCSLAIHHFPDLKQSFSEIARTLQTQGFQYCYRPFPINFKKSSLFYLPHKKIFSIFVNT